MCGRRGVKLGCGSSSRRRSRKRWGLCVGVQSRETVEKDTVAKETAPAVKYTVAKETVEKETVFYAFLE